jgi:RNA polymerase sigma-70 factor (ECF subfamily)
MAGADELWDGFRRGWSSEEPPPAIDVVEAIAARGAAAWPALALPPEPWGEAIGRAGENVEAVDLYLATACVHGVDGAVAAFEATYGAEIDAALRARDRSDSAAADLRQAARERLFVGRKLAEYRGTGPLLHWLRVVVVRFRIDTKRRNDRAPKEAALETGLAVEDVANDPELAYLKSHYRDLMQAAFADAVASLEARERLVLRYQLVERLSTEKIATVFGVHAATARRWAASAREQLWKETRAGIMRRLGIRRAEFESIVRLVRSELDMSVVRLLAEPER